MIKKTITYTDLFTEEELTGDFYFNLTEVEVLEYMAEDEQGMDKVLQRIVDAPNAKAVLKQLKILVRMAYGVRTSDGEFIKSEELTNKFIASSAYSALLEEMILDESKASEFAIMILPKKYREPAQKAASGENVKKLNPKPATQVARPKKESVAEKTNTPDLTDLTDEQLQAIYNQITQSSTGSYTNPNV